MYGQQEGLVTYDSFRPHNWPQLAGANMGRDQSGGCLMDYAVNCNIARPIVEPNNSGRKKLSTNVLINCDQSVHEHKSLSNL